MDPFLVHHFLERAADTAPERTFLHEAEGVSSYGTVLREAWSVAAALAQEGAGRGERVALLARNSRAYVSAYYGALRAGAAVVPLNAAAAEEDLAAMLADCRPRAAVAGPGLGARLGRAIGRLPLKDRPRIVLLPAAEAGELPSGVTGRPLEEVLDAAEPPPEAPLIDLDPASIVYTSGSTGRPRGAMLRHLNLVANTRSIVSYLRLTAEDRVLAVLPFHYVYGIRRRDARGHRAACRPAATGACRPLPSPARGSAWRGPRDRLDPPRREAGQRHRHPPGRRGRRSEAARLRARPRPVGQDRRDPLREGPHLRYTALPLA